MPKNESVSASLIRRSDLQDDGIVAVDVVIDGEIESVLLYRNKENVSAWLNVCPHAGRRLDYAPGQFLRDQGRLVCAAHGASFQLDSGKCVAGPCRGASLREVAMTMNEAGEIEFG